MTGVDKQDAGTVKTVIDYVSHLQNQGLKGKRIGIVSNLIVTIQRN